jgi:flagellar basal-body rod modification protein FlgD
MSTVSSVSSSWGQNTSDTSALNRTPVQTLDQDDFLRLVVAQMTSQDPLNPQTDTQFIAQMAQFTTLEQSKSMQSDIAQLRLEQQLLQANALLGRVVQLQDEQGALISGTVSAVQVKEGSPQLVVNGQPYDLSALLTIEPASDTSQR